MGQCIGRIGEWHRSCSAWWQRNFSSYRPSRPTRKRRFPAYLTLNVTFKPWIRPIRHLQTLVLLVHLLKLIVLMWTTCTTNSIKRNACCNVWKLSDEYPAKYQESTNKTRSSAYIKTLTGLPAMWHNKQVSHTIRKLVVAFVLLECITVNCVTLLSCNVRYYAITVSRWPFLADWAGFLHAPQLAQIDLSACVDVPLNANQSINLCSQSNMIVLSPLTQIQLLTHSPQHIITDELYWNKPSRPFMLLPVLFLLCDDNYCCFCFYDCES